MVDGAQCGLDAAPCRLQIGGQHGPGKCGRGDHAVQKQFYVAYGQRGLGRERALIVELRQRLDRRRRLGRIGPLRRRDEQSEVRARREFARALHRRKGIQRRRFGRRVQKCGDSLLTQCVESRRGRFDVVRRRRRRNQFGDRLLRGVFENSRGVAGGIPTYSAAERILGLRGDAGELQGARIDQRRMAEGRLDEDRPLGLEGIERGPIGMNARRHHALLKPIHHLQPGIRLEWPRLVETRLNPRLQLRNAQLLVVQVALQQRTTALQRMHVAVDQPRHEHASVQIEHRRLGTDERRNAGIAADIDDAARADRERLLHTVAGIDGVHVGVAVHRVGNGCGFGRRRCEAAIRTANGHRRHQHPSLKLHQVRLPGLQSGRRRLRCRLKCGSAHR